MPRRSKNIVATLAMPLLLIAVVPLQPAVLPVLSYGSPESAFTVHDGAFPGAAGGSVLLVLLAVGCWVLILAYRASRHHRVTPTRAIGAPLAASAPCGTLAALMAPELTRARIRSEWSIAERTGQPFAALAWQLVDPQVDPRPALRLVRALRPHLHAGDEIGWLDRTRLAVLMPMSGSEDAWVTAARVASELSRSGAGIPLQNPMAWATDGSRGPMANDAGSTASERTMPVALLAGDPLPRWKRAVDVAGAGTALLVLSPILLIGAILVKLSSPGPILFRQLRAGCLGTPFRIYKFRTMVVNAEALKERLRAFNERSGPVFKMTRDPRITRLGRLLRVTSIDELPQLWNVLIGDMSLVGPRPPSLDELPSYQPWQRHRLDVKPGITCLWQVEARGGVEFAEWVRMDLRYIRRRSLLYDLSLMARTVPAVVSTRGAC